MWLAAGLQVPVVIVAATSPFGTLGYLVAVLAAIAAVLAVVCALSPQEFTTDNDDLSQGAGSGHRLDIAVAVLWMCGFVILTAIVIHLYAVAPAG